MTNLISCVCTNLLCVSKREGESERLLLGTNWIALDGVHIFRCCRTQREIFIEIFFFILRKLVFFNPSLN